MQTVNLQSSPANNRRTGFTGYLDDFGVTIRIWWWQLKRQPVIAFLAVVGFVAVLSIFVPRPAAPSAVLPAPQIIVATPTAAHQLVSDERPVVGLRLDRAVIAYDAPNGQEMDAIEPGRAYEVLAKLGANWTQIALANGPDVWVRSEKLPGYAPDIATAVPTAAPLAPESEVVYVSAPAEPAAAPAIAAKPTAVLIADAQAASACDGLSQPDFVCVVGSEDGQVYWLPAR